MGRTYNGVYSGQEPKWTSQKDLDELEKQIEEYFDICDAKEKHYTITGLCLHIDIERKTLMNWREGIIKTVDAEIQKKIGKLLRRASTRVEESYEQYLVKQACTGSIFALKQFGWVDKQEIVTTTKSELEDLDITELAELAEKFNKETKPKSKDKTKPKKPKK